MFHVVLYEPEIPANTGNIGRLCVGLGATLHLVGRTGFKLDDSSVRRAGLDHWKDVTLRLHSDFASVEAEFPLDRMFFLSAHAKQLYTTVTYQPGDVFVFGCESRGLPPEVISRHRERTFTVPMPTGKVRSLNLSNAVSIVTYEALRQVQLREQVQVTGEHADS